METVRILDPGWKKVGSGIRDKHPGSATLSVPGYRYLIAYWQLEYNARTVECKGL
jgi:hypothetical protein